MNLWVSLKLLLKCLGLSLCTPELLCRGTLSIWLNKSSRQKFNFYAKISSLLARCLESKVYDSPSLELFALELLSKALLGQLIFSRNYLKTPFVVGVQLLGPVWLFSTPGTAAGSSVPPSPRVCSDSRPSSHWCHRAIFSASPFSFCLQSFPASGSFPMSWLFTSGDQRIGASASASVFPMSIQGWFP